MKGHRVLSGILLLGLLLFLQPFTAKPVAVASSRPDAHAQGSAPATGHTISEGISPANPSTVSPVTVVLCPQTASVSAGSSWNSAPAGAFDCNPGTGWNSGNWSGVIWAQYTTAVTFSAVHLSVCANPATNETYAISGSNNGSTWAPIITTILWVPLGCYSLAPITFPPVTFQYLRISVSNSASWVSITDVKLTVEVPGASGRVTDTHGQGVAGVTITASPAITTSTNSNGDYTLTGLPGGANTITPSNGGYTFSPPSSNVNVPPDATGVDFIATPNTPTSVGLIGFDASSAVPGWPVANIMGAAAVFLGGISLWGLRRRRSGRVG